MLDLSGVIDAYKRKKQNTNIPQDAGQIESQDAGQIESQGGGPNDPRWASNGGRWNNLGYGSDPRYPRKKPVYSRTLPIDTPVF